jgi:hypothetical protein
MAAKMAVRVIKRGERGTAGREARPEKASGVQSGGLEAAARQAKAAVKSWISARQEPRMDPRRAFAELFRTV